MFFENTIYSVENILVSEYQEEVKINNIPATPSQSIRDINKNKVLEEAVNRPPKDTPTTLKPPVTRKLITRNNERTETRFTKLLRHVYYYIIIGKEIYI